jgi:hypothetical protein
MVTAAGAPAQVIAHLPLRQGRGGARPDEVRGDRALDAPVRLRRHVLLRVKTKRLNRRLSFIS